MLAADTVGGVICPILALVTSSRAGWAREAGFSSVSVFTLAPSTYASASVTQLFYLNNFMHDRLYQLGFDEASGNFEVKNYSGAVLLISHDRQFMDEIVQTVYEIQERKLDKKDVRLPYRED